MHFKRHRIGFLLAVLAAACWYVMPCPAEQDSTHCAICGNSLTGAVYTATDQVTGEKKFICESCLKLPDVCFVCGMPVKDNVTRLSDGRVLCERDAKNAVLDDDHALRIYSDTIDELNRALSRFASFPVTNVDVKVVDRVNLVALFKVPGNDYTCPNVLGYTQSRTNHGTIHHTISIMSALTEAQLRAVCAHEISHAWVYENVPAARRKALSQDAHEGWCELVAWLLMDSRHDDEQKAAILKNQYTRGQIDCFIAAQDHFGLDEVMDWMKFGVDDRLDCDDITKVRNIVLPQPRAASRTIVRYAPSPVEIREKTLVLKGIMRTGRTPLALINNETFSPGESHPVHVGGTNAIIRCLSIEDKRVRIRLMDSGEEMDLQLKADKN